MLDCRGKELRAGDLVAYASPKYGLTFGELKYDAEEKSAYHIIKADGTMYYPQKPNRWKQRKDRDLEMLNLTAYAEDALNARL